MKAPAEVLCWRCQTRCPDHEHCGSCGADPRLNGRWVLESVLGEGAVGMTFRGRELSTGRLAALKELSFRKVQSIKTLELFDREIAVLRRIDHPAVPDYYDDFVVEEPGRVHLFLVQELIDGAVLSLARPWPVDEVLALLEPLCAVLAILHAYSPPIIHRDIKPSNVMRRRDGSIVLIDFGSVRNVARDAVVGGSTVAGTFGYMAPEQLRGVALPASDLYGVGALAIALLAGRDAAELLDPIRPTAWREQLRAPAPVLDLLAELVEPDETKRPADAREVGSRLAALARGEPGSAAAARTTATAIEIATDGSVATTESVDTHRALATLRRQWRRVAWAEAIETTDWWTPLIFVAPLTGVSVFLWAAIEEGLGLGVGFGGSAMVVAALVGSTIGSWYVARFAWVVHNPWRHGPLRTALLRSWPHEHGFEAELREGMRAEPKYAVSRLDMGMGKAREAWAKREPTWLLPLLESQGYAHALLGNVEQAAEVLSEALAIGRERFGEGDVRHVDQLLRYAVPMARATGRREEAVELYAKGQVLRARLEREHGRPFAALLADALGLARTGAVGPDDPRAQLAAEARKRRALALVPAQRWDTVIIVHAFLALILSLPFAALLNGVANIPLGVTVAGLLGLFAGVPWLIGPPLHRRHGRGGWRERLFPDFDDVWPRDHRSRALFIGVAEHAWDSPFRIPKAQHANLHRIVHRHQRATEDRSGSPELQAMLRRMRQGNDTDDDVIAPLDPRQLWQVEALEVLCAYYVSQITDKLAELPTEGEPTGTRATLLRTAALFAWQEGHRDLALAWWTEALRR